MVGNQEVGRSNRRLLRIAAAPLVCAITLLWAWTPANATAYTCSPGFSYFVQRSTPTHGGVSGVFTTSSEDLADGNAHIVQEVEVHDSSHSCAVGTGCWVQDGFLRGTIGLGGVNSGDQSTPQVYWETSNPYAYAVTVRQGLSGTNIPTFFNSYSMGTTDAYGRWNWASYATRVNPWAPVLLGVAQQYQLTEVMTAGLELYVNTTQPCPSPHLSTFDQLQNAPYPANTWTNWTSPIGFAWPVAASPPYYYVRYQNYWLFQTNGAY
jgi:hypothetical protein